MSILELMKAHEWGYAEGPYLFCETCGIKHRDSVSAKSLKHRKGCEYERVLKNLEGKPLLVQSIDAEL